MKSKKEWWKASLSSLELEQIKKKIKELESVTSAEVVTVVANRSSTVSHLKMTLFLVSLVVGFCLYFLASYSSNEIDYESYIFYGYPIIAFFLSLMLSRSDFVQRIFVPKLDRSHQVNSKSQLEFYRLNINKTKLKTGILIYLSVMERQVVVLADRSISEKLPTNTWEDIVKTITAGIHEKNLAAGIINGLNDCKERLATHFPIEKDDVNELPNQVILRTHP